MEAKPRGQNADVAEFMPQDPCMLNHLQSKFRLRNIHEAGSPGSIESQTGEFNPSYAYPPTRFVSSTCSSIRPWLEETKGMTGTPAVRSTAPAVHIRSVVTVCSSPPGKRSAGPSQEGPHPSVERMRAGEQSEDVSAGTSKYGKLHSHKRVATAEKIEFRFCQ
ncbi:double-stranded RNA-binding protein 2-like isoform X1 [Tripterygium wilfordii]|uniref:Double-stranded RNA-binding protein 2-like isoform X1 n=1 Tax=Tripterygium wilfordii TaxID=458696 RepID=A0A7J7CX56_TRIWF|nr:double-stranded RNA-binding protein 2-like isoform X1 [Tripterygium wilfordii]